MQKYEVDISEERHFTFVVRATSPDKAREACLEQYNSEKKSPRSMRLTVDVEEICDEDEDK